MSTKSKRHVHKYHKLELSYGPVWACALSDCNHYMPQHMTEMVCGKYSLCWTCGERFTLDTENMKNDKPICNDCAPRATAITEFLSDLDMK